MDVQILILSAADNRQAAEIDKYEFLRYFKRWQDLDEFEFQFSGDTEQGQNLVTNGIVPSRNSFILNCVINGTSDFAGLIDVCSLTKSKSQKVWSVHGFGLDRYLSDRPILPPSGQSQDQYSGVAETLMKSLVDRHLINPITTGIDGITDSHRAVDLVNEIDGLQGLSVSFDGRFQRLDECLKEIARSGGDLGFSVEIVGTEKRFRVGAGEDKTATAVFAIDLDNIESIDYVDDGLEYANVVIAAGQGEGIDRLVISRGDGRNSGRREIFQDMRDLQTVAAMERRCESTLAERSVSRSFTATLLPGIGPAYLEDYRVGDLVTIRDDELGINEQIRIQEVEVEITGGKEPRVTPSFGRQRINIKDTFKRLNSSSPSSRT